MMIWLRTIVLIALAGTFYSCNKIRAHKYSGTYNCIVESSSVVVNVYSDTTYETTVVVEQDDHEIKVLNHTVPAKELKNKTLYTEGGNSSSSFELMFHKDSIFILFHSGGVSGGSLKIYRGKKTK